ncbi:MAG: pyridoxamine 5'-phosphate oxidase family protein [Candidatus Bathyarchaeota archaeon]|nr:pyridoxamine 5'-phosphate oxidase family protein [Candidatus Bathyarchaeota archaeon]
MNKIEGMEEAFKKAKVVFMTTYDGDKENTRQMTNYNESPYGAIWFPTEKNTRKVKDIETNPKILLTFPAGKKGEFYEINGEASFASESEVESKWEWWWLYWHPAQKNRFWFPRSMTENRAIININPVEARLVRRS